MLEVSKSFPGYEFIVAKAPGQEDGFMNHCYKRTTTFLLFEMKLTRCWQKSVAASYYKRHRNIGNGIVRGA